MIEKADKILSKYEDDNEYHFHKCDREWIMKAMVELAESEVKKLTIHDVSKSLAPHRCPVCNGNGLVPNGFYMQTSGHWSTSSITPETCRSCGGTGIVWG